MTGGERGTHFQIYHTSIYNQATINGNIKVEQGATLNGGIFNTNPYATSNATITGNIEVAGTINAEQYAIFNVFANITGNIDIKQNATLSQGIYNQTEIDGQIKVEGTVKGFGIRNHSQGTIKKGIVIEEKATISEAINNQGKIEQNIEVKGYVGGGIHNS
ncbi:hypothetical protein, partial [Campylobacter vulpis]|uniref:hypothetical protein n=1 Tax=Campylobacter vulpis TaxID=1655500 RepID=UPI001BD0888D